MTITIDTKSQVFKTIGHTEDFKPVLWFKIGQRKQAIQDLTSFYNTFNEFLATGVELTPLEWVKFGEQFEAKARVKALEVIDNVVIHKDKFFSFLR